MVAFSHSVMSTYEDLLAKLDALSAPAPEDTPKARTRARLLRAAKALFEQHGYRRTSVDEVARQSGVAKGTVYVHFKSKAELMLHVLLEEKRRLIVRFQPLFTQPMPPVERLRAYLELLLLTLSESPLSLKLMCQDQDLQLFLEELPEPLRAQVSTQQAQGLEMLLEGVGLPEAEREERTRAFQGILHSFGHLMAARGPTGLTPASYARQLARILVDGLRAP